MISDSQDHLAPLMNASRMTPKNQYELPICNAMNVKLVGECNICPGRGTSVLMEDRAGERM